MYIATKIIVTNCCKFNAWCRMLCLINLIYLQMTQYLGPLSFNAITLWTYSNKHFYVDYLEWLNFASLKCQTYKVTPLYRPIGMTLFGNLYFQLLMSLNVRVVTNCCKCNVFSLWSHLIIDSVKTNQRVILMPLLIPI